MAKTLKDFLNERQLGPMVVKNPDEQKFIDKHVVAKTDDRNGNDDELFKGSKVKMADRPKHRKGYNPGEDEEVYEALKGAQHKIDANKNGKVDAHDFHLLRKKKKVAEEAEELEELDHKLGGTLSRYINKTKGDDKREDGRNLALKKRWGDAKYGTPEPKVKAAVREEAEELDEISAGLSARAGDKADNRVRALANKRKSGSSASPLENKLRAQRNKFDNYSDKKQGYTAEEAEQIDEISAEKKDAYAQKAGKQLPGLFAKSASADGARKYYNRKNAVRKIANEEAEQVDEKLDMKKASMGTVVKDFQKSDAPQFMGKSQKKRQVMAVAAKLTAERGGKPLNKEERLLTKLADISETHKRTMVSVFEKLNEDNQREFMLACDTAEGIEQMLDFSIQHRGE